MKRIYAYITATWHTLMYLVAVYVLGKKPVMMEKPDSNRLILRKMQEYKVIFNNLAKDKELFSRVNQAMVNISTTLENPLIDNLLLDYYSMIAMSFLMPIYEDYFDEKLPPPDQVTGNELILEKSVPSVATLTNSDGDSGFTINLPVKVMFRKLHLYESKGFGTQHMGIIWRQIYTHNQQG